VDESLRAELVREIRSCLDAALSDAGDSSAGAISDRQLRLAAAILMVWLVRADGASRQDEHRSLEDGVSRALGLAPGEGAIIVRAAEEAADLGVPFAEVVARLARGSSGAQRLLLVESLWRIAFADAELADHEEYLVRKIAGLLGLTSADLVETKVRAREAFVRDELER
jgi:uncharacterized tellurite resistance protein B-like protein